MNGFKEYKGIDGYFVYVITTENDGMYVGSTTSICKRLQNHHILETYDIKNIYYKSYPCADKKQLRAYEQLTINRLKPDLNRIPSFYLVLKKPKIKKPKIFVCFQCKEVLPSKQQVDEHENKCNGQLKRSFICSKCGKELSSKQRLDEHEKKCNGQRKGSYTCSWCGKHDKHKGNHTKHEMKCNQRPILIE